MALPKTAPRPTSVKIGYITFGIEYLSDDQWKEKEFSDDDGGRCFGAEATIFVRDNGKIDQIHIREILLHEILHACFYSSGLAIEDNLRVQENIEEHVVWRVSPVLLDTLRSNPEVSRFLESR